jgi:hypothetical protein
LFPAKSQLNARPCRRVQRKTIANGIAKSHYQQIFALEIKLRVQLQVTQAASINGYLYYLVGVVIHNDP